LERAGKLSKGRHRNTRRTGYSRSLNRKYKYNGLKSKVERLERIATTLITRSKKAPNLTNPKIPHSAKEKTRQPLKEPNAAPLTK
jgi:hypothetical protein